MKVPIFSRLIFVAFAAVAAPAVAQVDSGKILEELGRIKEQREAALRRVREGALRTIKAASANDAAAIDAYQEAVRAVQFAGTDKESAQYREWKKAEGDRLRSAPVRRALRYHLSHLGMTLRRANGEELETLLPDLLNHAASLVKDHDLLHPEDGATKRLVESLLNPSVADGAIAKWLQVSQKLEGAQDWELSAGNAEALYNKVVLPELRKNKDPRLLGYWDAQVEIEGGRADDGGRYGAASFADVRRPALLWKRAEDLLLLGKEEEAVKGMFGLIKSHPGHPEAGEWITRLENVLKDAPASSS